MDDKPTDLARIIEQQLTILGQLDATEFPVGAGILGVTDEQQQQLFLVIVTAYKLANEESKAIIIQMLTTIAPHQFSKQIQWELVAKLWTIAEKLPQVQAWDKLRHHLAILWGQEFARDIPFMLRELILHLGITADELPTMTLDEFARRLRANAPKESMFERIYLALDLIFEVRYGWPQGTARTNKPQDLLLALEHALEYTPANKPSIWDMT